MRASIACRSAQIARCFEIDGPSLPRATRRAAGDVVRLAKRQAALAHQPVGEVGRGGEAVAGGAPHRFGAAPTMSSTMPAVAASMSSMLSAASNNASLSSCMSLE